MVLKYDKSQMSGTKVLEISGVIIARDTPETQQVLQRWWAVGEEEAATLYGRRHEQSALDILLATHPHITPRIGGIPKKKKKYKEKRKKLLTYLVKCIFQVPDGNLLAYLSNTIVSVLLLHVRLFGILVQRLVNPISNECIHMRKNY